MELARLHRACLPDSVVGLLGERFVRAFYRYVDRSPLEILAVQRDERDRVVAAAVVSLAPETIYRRLLVATPLALALLVRPVVGGRLAWSMFRSAAVLAGGAPGAPEPGIPELILTFVDPREQGRGRGRSLIREVESRLRERGAGAFKVRTESRPGNAARGFYAALGFVPHGASVRFGTRFDVLTRTIDPA